MSMGPSGELGFDRHPLQGQPLGMSNHKEDDSMDLEEEGDEEKSKNTKLVFFICIYTFFSIK